MKMRGTIELKIQRTSLKTKLEVSLKTIEPRLKVPFKTQEQYNNSQDLILQDL
jgi:hypothetical protein